MRDARSRLEGIALAAAGLLVVAFLVSSIAGIVRRPASDDRRTETPEELPASPPGDRGRVEVLNASGRSGLARAATLQLRDAGFDVVYFGNAREDRSTSIVLDRAGKKAVADDAARALGIATVRAERDSTLLLEASVIIGLDWRKRQVEQQAEQRGWKATLRRWLGR